MICQPCRDGVHTVPARTAPGRPVCPGKGQCDCQHRDPGCNAGVTPCGATPSRLYACGRRCEEHKP